MHSLSKSYRSRSSSTTVNGGSQRRGERGYAYVMALAMVLMMIAGSQIILRNVVTEAKAQKEADMIWRGNQYARAIRMYNQKTGHFPQSQDDLITGVPGRHFLRAEAMKDPMNKDSDGEWRFIYMNAAGTIIGSVKYGSLQQMALMDMNGGQMPGAQQGNSLFPSDSNNQNSNSTTDTGNQNNSNNGSATTTTNTNTTTATNGLANGNSNGAPQQNGSAQQNGNGLTNSTPFGQQAIGIANSQPTGPVDSPVFGATIIGVGSKVDKASVKVYKGGKKYNQWEFIYNPIEEQQRAVQAGLTGAGGIGGQNPVSGISGGILPLGQMPTGAAPTTGNGTTTNGSNSTNDPNNPNSSTTPQQ